MTPKQAVELDEDGFLMRPEDWSCEVAEYFAKLEGIELTGDHWKVINFLRDYYLKFGSVPMVRAISKATGFSARELYRLFPSGPLKQAARIGGLPKPSGCV